MTPDSIVILIADSNGDDRAALVGALRDMGLTVFQAVDGGSAVKVVGDHAVDVAVVNDDMTPRTGFDFARQMALRGGGIGMILTTGAAPADLLLEAQRLGFGHVVKKPVDPVRLAAMVRRLVERAGPGHPT